MNDALIALKARLVGHYFVRLTVGEQWGLMLESGTWVVAHDIAFAEEMALTSLLANADPPVLDGVDSWHAPKAALACRAMRRTIAGVALDADAGLELRFDDGRALNFPTRTPVVDWQWAVSDDGSNPYTGSFVAACLARGDVLLGGIR